MKDIGPIVRRPIPEQSSSFELWKATATPSLFFLSTGVLASWQQKHEREFSAVEQYAIAKMALFHAFDEHAGPSDMVEAVCVHAARLDAIVEELDID